MPQLKPLSRAIALLLAAAGSVPALAGPLDHHEFGAMLHVPYRAEPGALRDARNFKLTFEYPYIERTHAVAWRVELLDPSGATVQRWYGVETLVHEDVTVDIAWAGRPAEAALPEGIYQVRLSASASEAAHGAQPVGLIGDFVEATLAADGAEVIEQQWDMQVGAFSATAMPAFAALPTRAAAAKSSISGRSGATPTAVPANANLPYTVYLGNLHSQTNHSDGGGSIGNCSGAQAPQRAPYGPLDAFNYAMDRGHDFLMASEHNHMYDGSDGTNTSQTPAYAKNLYQAGLDTARNFNTAHPGFLALYGMEWGVINNGGHLNILNSNELFGWEYNSSGQLLAHTYTEKNNYAALYTLMAQRGLVGQFNHPDSSGQFKVNNLAFGHTEDGEKAMALCEVSNTSAYSNNTTETETSRSNYESACKVALEAGFKVAFTTNQDNHCANWGASYTNRNGVLIPNGTPLTQASFVEAIKARRLFASYDKNSQLILTANGRLMGESFTNAGPLNLVANFSNSAGRKVSTVQIFEGVPKRRGTVTVLSSQAVTTVTPALGAHFYYAKVTQDDGKILWSAPVWVTQTADTTPPTVSAAVTGSSGTIRLSAEASDNVGVTRVDFLVDGTSRGSSTAAPHAINLDSKTLANGPHTLSATAFDAAGNSASSAVVGFNIANSADVSAQVGFAASGLVLNRATQLYSGTITLTNHGAALSGPLQLKLVGLPAGVSLGNASGSHAGAPYITLGAGSLAAGASVVVPLSFANPAKVGLGYTAQLHTGSF